MSAGRTLVPNFLAIKARQIQDWANRLDARDHLPVLLRKLVHSTGAELRKVDFPGYDNAQRRGSDGFVEAGAATAWVPGGESYWEFGTDQRPKDKAESDYRARLASIGHAERARSSFVFVTPRNWPGKSAWEKDKSDAGDWKAVRAFDASDLEQWLEQAVLAKIWFAEQISLPIIGYETLEHALDRWTNASEPSLTSEIFAPALTAYRGKIKKWLDAPSDRPFVITADSRDEALGFLACLFDDEEFRQFKDRAAVFTSAAPLRMLIASSVPLIPIVHSEDIERELGGVYRQLHCIVYRPRNAVDAEADIALDLLRYDDFKKALASMGIEEGDVDRLARESGRSPTILRRRLSKNSAIRRPTWAQDGDAAKTLVPMALIGVWRAESSADREIISYIADCEYEAVEDEVVRLLRLDDSPVWSVGQYRGVASKVDALFAIAGMVISAVLERFFTAAEYLLSESDPARELPERDQWAAALYGKVRNHSNALRNGVCETLILLSVHGNNLFQDRLGTDVGGRVRSLIRQLLTPLTLEKLLDHNRNLPRYAEAAPDEFMEIIENDLRSGDPVVLDLLAPVVPGSFPAPPSRSGLLWALECLAWKAKNLPRVVAILAQLSQVKLDDNWMNKPGISLQTIFRSWIPQTAASLEQRCQALELLARRFPDVGWEICIEEFQPGPWVSSPSYRPRWRSDASGAGDVVTHGEVYDFRRKALDLLISWAAHDEKTLGALVEALPRMPEQDQVKVWDLIDEWSQVAGDMAKAALRERIRRSVPTRVGHHPLYSEAIRDRAREAYDHLRPDDPVARHGWLFAEHGVRESRDEIGEDFDYQKHENRIDTLRREAMAEIWNESGHLGVEALFAGSNAAERVGHYTVLCVNTTAARIEVIRRCLSIDGDTRGNAERCLQGFLSAVEDDLLAGLLRAAAEGLTAGECVRLFVRAPFRSSTWRLLDDYGEYIRTEYWRGVVPTWGRRTPAELTELIDRLLEVRRPRAAFNAAYMDLNDVETSRLKRLLHDIATVGSESTGYYGIDRYYISEALHSLNGRAGVTQDEMAQLEFLHIEALQDSRHGIPNLERKLVQSPDLYFWVLTIISKRDDGEEDPAEWRIGELRRRGLIVLAAHRLLDYMGMIPGIDEAGKVNAAALSAWLDEVRRLCREHARTEIGDYRLGQLLAKAPESENGLWPCEAVCEVMENIASSELGQGFRIGVLNSRGVVCRGTGGDQERDLAAKYRGWAEQLNFKYPYVGQVIESIAESYDRQAKDWDLEADIEKRIHF